MAHGCFDMHDSLERISHAAKLAHEDGYQVAVLAVKQNTLGSQYSFKYEGVQGKPCKMLEQLFKELVYGFKGTHFYSQKPDRQASAVSEDDDRGYNNRYENDNDTKLQLLLDIASLIDTTKQKLSHQSHHNPIRNSDDIHSGSAHDSPPNLRYSRSGGQQVDSMVCEDSTITDTADRTCLPTVDSAMAIKEESVYNSSLDHCTDDLYHSKQAAPRDSVSECSRSVPNMSTTEISEPVVKLEAVPGDVILEIPESSGTLPTIMDTQSLAVRQSDANNPSINREDKDINTYTESLYSRTGDSHLLRREGGSSRQQHTTPGWDRYDHSSVSRPRVPESHSIAASNDDIFPPMVQSLEQQRQLQRTHPSLSTQEHIHVSSQPHYPPTSAINQSQTYHKNRERRKRATLTDTDNPTSPDVDPNGDFKTKRSKVDGLCGRGRLDGRGQGQTRRRRAIYYISFNPEWLKKYEHIAEVPGDKHHYWCLLCQRKNSCSHMGEGDVRRHMNCKMHKEHLSRFQAKSK